MSQVPKQADEVEIERLHKEAQAASDAEDWDRAIALYRQLLSFSRVIQGAEAKLQWALRMKDTEAVYRQGKAHLDAGRYNDALAALRKARLMYASHYKDVDALIVQVQTTLQKQNWETRPVTNQKKGCFVLGGALALIAFVAIGLAACVAATPASNPTSGTVQPASSNPARAGNLTPQQRINMYKSAPAMAIDVNKKYVATIKTVKGSIVVELNAKDAPQTVNNFVFLVRDGFYDNLTFHRVEPGFVIQGGDPRGNGQGGPGYTVPAEIRLKHTKGAIAMARLSDQVNPKRDSSGSQFYITLDATPFLDDGYTAFGYVTQGMEVVEKIAVGDVMQTVRVEEK